MFQCLETSWRSLNLFLSAKFWHIFGAGELHPWSFNGWKLKKINWKKEIPFEKPIIFRFHVENLGGGSDMNFPWKTGRSDKFEGKRVLSSFVLPIFFVTLPFSFFPEKGGVTRNSQNTGDVKKLPGGRRKKTNSWEAKKNHVRFFFQKDIQSFFLNLNIWEISQPYIPTKGYSKWWQQTVS